MADGEEKDKAWHFDKSQGSYTKSSQTLFWYGVEDLDKVISIINQFTASQATAEATPLSKAGARTYSTSVYRSRAMRFLLTTFFAVSVVLPPYPQRLHSSVLVDIQDTI